MKLLDQNQDLRNSVVTLEYSLRENQMRCLATKNITDIKQRGLDKIRSTAVDFERHVHECLHPLGIIY